MCGGHCAAWVLIGNVWELAMTPFANDVWRPLCDMGFIRKCVGIGNDPRCQRYMRPTLNGSHWVAWVLFGNVWGMGMGMPPFANDMGRLLRGLGFIRKNMGIANDPLCQRYATAIVRPGRPLCDMGFILKCAGIGNDSFCQRYVAAIA